MKKNIINLAIAVVAILSLNNTAFAQVNYTNGAGLRLGGYENGLTLKHFTDSETALEGIIGFRPGVFVVTGLYEKHQIAFAEPSLNFFYGAGAHIGGISGDRYYRSYGRERYYGDSGILLGVDGIAGLEWQIPELPLAVSVDLHPRVEIANLPLLNMEAALSIRYTF